MTERAVPTSFVLAHADALSQLLRQLGDELNDDMMLWEPVPGCWSIRRQPDGAWHYDWTPDPAIAPFTTIAWRLAHIGQSLAAHARRLFGRGEFAYDTYEPAGDLAGAMHFVRDGFEHWRAGIAACGEELPEALARETISFNTHHFRHAAEILTVRDLYRASRPLDGDPFVDACLRGDTERVNALAKEDASSVASLAAQHEDLVTAVARMGRWDLVRVLLALGFAPDPADGATALHYAAACGPVSCIRVLLEHGADPGRRDPVWNSIPRGWAEYFGHAEAVDYLASVSARDN